MNIPDEILVEILKNLNLRELINLTLVHIQLKMLIERIEWDHFQLT